MAEGKHTNGAGEAQRRMAIDAVREALAELHRALIDAARFQHEREQGAPVPPGELLRLLTQDAGFAWLQPVSELIADLDALQAEPASHDLAAAVRRALDEQLFAPAAGEPSAFRARYTAMLQAEPRVAMAHGAVRQLLAALPEASKGPAAESLHERHQQVLAKKRRR